MEDKFLIESLKIPISAQEVKALAYGRKVFNFSFNTNSFYEEIETGYFKPTKFSFKSAGDRVSFEKMLNNILSTTQEYIKKGELYSLEYTYKDEYDEMGKHSYIVDTYDQILAIQECLEESREEVLKCDVSAKTHFFYINDKMPEIDDYISDYFNAEIVYPINQDKAFNEAINIAKKEWTPWLREILKLLK